MSTEATTFDMNSAAGAFDALLSEEASGEQHTEETAEQVAERLAAEDANASNEDESKEKIDDSQEDDKVEQPETVTIEVDGKPVEMSKAELAEAVKGQMRQQDYTQKTMAVAEERKAAQAEQQAARAEREKLANQLHVYTVQQQGALSHIEAQMTDELLQSDPVQYLALERTLKKGQADLAKASSDLAELQKQYQVEQQDNARRFMTDQLSTLVAKVPEWKDGAKMQSDMKQIESFMESVGYKADDGMFLLDARTIMMARDAMKYRDLMQRATKATAKVAAAPPKVERPGVAAPQKGGNEAFDSAVKKLNKTGKINDAAAAFAALM